MEDIDILQIFKLLEKGFKVRGEGEKIYIEKEEYRLYKVLKYNYDSEYYVKKILDITINEDKEKILDNYLLPVGSIIEVKGINMLIMARCVLFNADSQYTEYVGVKYPEGMVSDEVFNFSHKDIDKIVYLGLSNEEELELVVQLKAWLDENEKSG